MHYPYPNCKRHASQVLLQHACQFTMLLQVCLSTSGSGTGILQQQAAPSRPTLLPRTCTSHPDICCLGLALFTTTASWQLSMSCYWDNVRLHSCQLRLIVCLLVLLTRDSCLAAILVWIARYMIWQDLSNGSLAHGRPLAHWASPPSHRSRHV